MRKIEKNKNVVIKHIIGETASMVIERLDDGTYKFTCDAYVSGELCKGGFFHLRQAREVIPGKKLGNNYKYWPRLRLALQKAGVPVINVPGGDTPIHYEDELVVPDFKVSGTHFFVIKRSDIKKYLKLVPLDEAGKKRAEEIRKEKEAIEAERYRQTHDPKYIAEGIGILLRHYDDLGGEFKRITLVSDGDTEYSIIYPECLTDLKWGGCSNVPKVVCNNERISFLSGWTAGRLDPRKHHRLKEYYARGWGRSTVYLMPEPSLADEVRETCRWLGLFDNPDNDGIPAEKIAFAKKVILEAFDLQDKLIKERWVYEKSSANCKKQYLHNDPYGFSGDIVRKPDWRDNPPAK